MLINFQPFRNSLLLTKERFKLRKSKFLKLREHHKAKALTNGLKARKVQKVRQIKPLGREVSSNLVSGI